MALSINLVVISPWQPVRNCFDNARHLVSICVFGISCKQPRWIGN